MTVTTPATPTTNAPAPFESVPDVLGALANTGYVADESLATVVYLATRLQKPLLLEGPAGVGKTELAKTLATALHRPLVRVQCYEGLDESRALYEWDYGKQLVYVQLLRNLAHHDAHDDLQDPRSHASERTHETATELFSERFLIERPLLRAIRSTQPVVLLIDEIDRADPEFEAMLLELLSDLQVTIPELGTITATSTPLVVLTSNANRELSEALRRRCLYVHVGYPSPSRELEILAQRVPEALDALRQQVVSLAQSLRTLDLQKPPSVSEVVEWTRALVLLGAQSLDPDTLERTLPVLLKHQDDIELAKTRAR
jgi:MoxR-like ATPase